MAIISYNPHTENDKFYYNENSTTVADFIKSLVDEITNKAGDNYKWTVTYPTGEITSSTNKVILSTTTNYGKTFYLKIFREINAEDGTYPISFIKMAIGTELNITSDDLADGKISPVVKLSWYRDSIDPSIKNWLPINYWINIDKDAINLVVRGDPSADYYPYNNFLTGYAYIGALKPIETDQIVDDKYNFGITASSSSEPEYTTTYGPRTGTGITDVCMVANKIGLPYQPHYPSFYTANPSMDKLNVEGSRWNNQKHQFSDITLVHPVDMERGKMINVLSGDSSALYDNDKLVFKQNTKEQEMYKKFKITAQYSFLNNSANVNYCIAIRCYNDDKEISVDDGNP